MGPTEGPSNHPRNQERTRPRRPRIRGCLLKGCEKRFHPNKAAQRYCSPECREAARTWSRWKAQQKYRATQPGKEKRQAQCRRNRKRVKSRKKHQLKAADEAARVITSNFFSIAPVTGRAATRGSRAAGDHRCNASAQGNAGGRWSESGRGNGAGRRSEPRTKTGAIGRKPSCRKQPSFVNKSHRRDNPDILIVHPRFY
jgi:hypothetical protein